MEQLDLLRYAVEVLEAQQIRYMIVGSYASMAYGEIRATRDIDIVVELSPPQLPAFIAAFPAERDFYLSTSAIDQAIRSASMFNVIHLSSGNKLDFMLARRDDWGKEQLARRQRTLVTPDVEGYTASPEDVILGKLWYYSEGESQKHLSDIAGILRAKHLHVDREYVGRWSAQLGFDNAWQSALEFLAKLPKP